MNELADCLEGARVSPGWAWVLLGLNGMAIVIWWFQRREGAFGGEISLPKALWLVFVIVLWVVVPMALWKYGLIWKVLLCSMMVRGVVEIFLCVAGRWKTSYGIGHDVVHLLLAMGALVMGGGPVLWLLLTAVTLIVEIGFVMIFQRMTGGPEEGVFFVPTGKKYRWVNRLTLLILLPTLGGFLFLIGRSIL